MEFRFFERDDDFDVVERRLPHWSQPGTVAFITFRASDSMPHQVVEEWISQRDTWLRGHRINPTDPAWKARLLTLDPRQQQDFEQRFMSRWHQELDQCHGGCVLRESHLSALVAEALLFFDGDRYAMTDFVVMPNHVHLLAAFIDSETMLKQCQSWKRFTAKKINAALGRRGRFWQPDAYDHLVRSERQFEYFQHYIADNPRNANLKPDEYVHYQTK